MTPAYLFRVAYLSARAAGYSDTRRKFADLVLATAEATPRLRASTKAWVREHPAPPATTQRRHVRLRVVEEQS